MLRRIFGSSQARVLPYETVDETCADIIIASQKQSQGLQKSSSQKILPNSILSISPSPSGVLNQSTLLHQDPLATPEVLVLLSLIHLDCIITPLKRSREDDPRCKATFSFSVTNEESSSSTGPFADILNVLNYKLPSDNAPYLLVEAEEGSASNFASALLKLRNFLDAVVELKRTDDDCFSPMSLENQAVSIVDIIFEKTIAYVESDMSRPIASALPGIFRSLHNLWSVIDLVDVSSKVLWCQTLHRSSTLLISCCSRPVSTYSQDSLGHIIAAVQALSQCITVFRDICGFPVSTSATMHFWPVCYHCMACIARCLAAGLLRDSSAKSLSSNIYRVLSSTAPSPQELPALIHNLNSTYSTTNVTSVARETASATNASLHKRRSSSATDGWSRVIFVLTGFQYLLHGAVEGDILRQKLTRPAEWITALGEALLICLSPTAALCLKHLAYTLAQYFLFAVVSCNCNKLSNVKDLDWIFLELSENLQKFSESWKKKQGYVARLQNIATLKLTGRPPSSQGNTGRTVTKKISIPQFSTSSPTNISEVTYAVGEQIEGLCTVQNGSKRWFPGVIEKVTLVSAEVGSVYSVLFSDGERREGVPAVELRYTRARRATLSRTSSGNSDRLSEFGQALGDVQTLKASQDVKAPIPLRSTPPPPAQEKVVESHVDQLDQFDGMSVDEEIHLINSSDHGDVSADDDLNIFEIPRIITRNTGSPLIDGGVSVGNNSICESVNSGLQSGVNFDGSNEDGANQLSKLRPGIVVPRMSLDNLDSGPGLHRATSTNSLSGALLRENKKVSDDFLSPRSAIDKILNELARDDGSSTNATKLDSWRDSAGWNTRRSTGRPSYPKSASANSLLSLSLNQLSQNNDVQRLVNTAVNDLMVDMAALKAMTSTYELIASVLTLKTVSDLSLKEKETTTPIEIQRILSTQNDTSKQPDPYVDPVQKDILMRPELNSGQCKLYMFAVREYLDSGVCDVNIPFLSMTASRVGSCYFRLLKLCSDRLFKESCVPTHLLERDKIAAGAFGSVYRVQCSETCCKNYSRGKVAEYAVKRLSRERSIQDEGVIFDVLTEVACLEIMATHVGVCNIINFGVHDGEYWMVLELGICNLQEWALEVMTQDTLLTASKLKMVNCQSQSGKLEGGDKLECESSDCVSSSVDKLLLKLFIFYEMASILNDVHKRNIIHFDIKCSNFVLRRIPHLDDFVHTVLYNKSSGVLFLTDFGEALQMSDDIDVKLKQRSRGTLAIQSPEMLCVSESGMGLASSMKVGSGDALINNDRKLDENKTYEINTPDIASDCWSMGCSLFELVTGEFLFDGKSFTEMFCLLCKEQFTLPDIDSMLVAKDMQPTSVPTISSCAAVISDLIKVVLVQNPFERPSLSDLIEATSSVIKSIIPFRSVANSENPLSSSGNASQHQEPFSPFYHLSSSFISPFKRGVEKDHNSNLSSANRSEADDFLVVLKNSSTPPPLAREHSNAPLHNYGVTSNILHNCNASDSVTSSNDIVHVEPGSWKFGKSISLCVSTDFLASVENENSLIALEKIYGDVNLKVNSIVKAQLAVSKEETIDSIELQSRISEKSDFIMKESLLHFLGKQYEVYQDTADSGAPAAGLKTSKSAKKCQINFYLSEPLTAPLRNKTGIASVDSVSKDMMDTEVLYETETLCIYPCEVFVDKSQTINVVRNAFIFAKNKYREGFHIQFCLDSFSKVVATHRNRSNSHIASEPVTGMSVEVSKTAFTAVVVLSALLYRISAVTDCGTVEGYIEKNYPWMLSNLDKALFQSLLDVLVQC